MGSVIGIFLYVLGAAIVIAVLFFVIRAAVLSALRTHHAEVHGSASTPVTYRDADGL